MVNSLTSPAWPVGITQLRNCGQGYFQVAEVQQNNVLELDEPWSFVCFRKYKRWVWLPQCRFLSHVLQYNFWKETLSLTANTLLTYARKGNPPTMPDDQITAYSYPNAKRKNNPAAGLAPEGKVKEAPKVVFQYNPHLPPVLRFDSSGKSDKLPELLEEAKTRQLTPDEIQMLADALQNRQPWLEWAGKQESPTCEVDPVALHIHERVSAQAILRVAAREDVTRSLFADPEQEYREAVQFYQHDVDWSNRLILGDSLQVMASLAKREDLAGKVQCIYMDPPYGIKYASNFQSEVGKRDVKDKPEDLTREPEMVKAYRDTWTLGVHSYLAYLRDRLFAAKELLTDSGSIFVQISDENLHRVRMLMDEVFGPENFVSQIIYTKTSGFADNLLATINDTLLWYAKDRNQVKYRPVYSDKQIGSTGSGLYSWVELSNGFRRRMTASEKQETESIPDNARIFRVGDISSQGYSNTASGNIECQGQTYTCGPNRHWTAPTEGMKKLMQVDRVIPSGKSLAYIRYVEDYPVMPFANVWVDTATGSFTDDKVYVVQSGTKAVARCLLMTTDPGDLVLDPTCGSGTTAYVAEQWGRRWITTDTSRVALAIARQRLLTSKFDYYTLRDPKEGVGGGFVYKTVPHVTLKSIAQNPALEPIFAEWEPVLDRKLEILNAALDGVTQELRQTLSHKLELKKRKRDKTDLVTDADSRRWQLPLGDIGWQHWQVPFDTDPDWPQELQDALTDYRQAWRAKMDAVNTTIAARADQEELVDKPNIERGKLRVCGPFTVEGVRPSEDSIDLDGPIDALDEELETFGGDGADKLGTVPSAVANAEAYLDKMQRLLRTDGVRFPGNIVQKFDSLQPVGGGDVLNAEGEWTTEAGSRRVAVAFGPEVGAVSAEMVSDCLRMALRRGYDDLVLAGFSFDGSAQALIQEDPNPRVRCHMAHIRPDVVMTDLLKDSPGAQLFTVSGLPRVKLNLVGSGEFTVEMQGVDIYDPVKNTIVSAGAGQVAAWFLDSDYDGGCFCITQAFFPDPKAWEKLSRALSGVVDADRFAALSGKTSLPFPIGKHKRAAVKVIDPRGNEVMRLLDLRDGGTRYAS